MHDGEAGVQPLVERRAEQVLHDQLLVERVVLGNPAEWNIDAPAAGADAVSAGSPVY